MPRQMRVDVAVIGQGGPQIVLRLGLVVRQQVDVPLPAASAQTWQVSRLKRFEWDSQQTGFDVAYLGAKDELKKER